MKLNEQAYQKLIDDNLKWLESMPNTVQKIHIIAILRESVEYHFHNQQTQPIVSDEEIREKIKSFKNTGERAYVYNSAFEDCAKWIRDKSKQDTGCQKCGNKLLLMYGTIDLYPDAEPYENDKSENPESGITEINETIHAHFCEKCDKIHDTFDE